MHVNLTCVHILFKENHTRGDAKHKECLDSCQGAATVLLEIIAIQI